MKKIAKYIFVCLIILPCLFLFTGCDWFTGETGESAYDIAVRNGFTGTEQQWLDSLKGPNGLDGTNSTPITIMDVYDAAVEEGYTGTFLEFLYEYLGNSNNTQSEDVYAVSKAVLSSVSISCRFNGGGTAGGAGVIYSIDKSIGEAYIVTNYHVVYNANAVGGNKFAAEIKVKIYGYERDVDAIEASYIGGSMEYDLAVIKTATQQNILKESFACEANLSNVTAVAGARAIAIGNPEGDGISATAGIISVESEYFSMKAADEATVVTFRAIRVDAAINPGNSGGGLFNKDGDLIGVVNAKIVDVKVDNMGYVIPLSIVRGVADNIIANCNGTSVKTIMKGNPGIEFSVASSKAVYDSVTKLTYIVEEVAVSSVNVGAASGDLQAGDKITKVQFGGEYIDINREFILNDLMLRVKTGDTLKIFYTRLGVPAEVNVTFQASHFTAVI